MKQLAAGLLALAITATLNTATAAPPALRQIQTGAAVTGEITSATAINYSDGSRSQIFALPLTAGQAVSLQLEGPLNGAISVFDRDLLLTRAEANSRGTARTTVRAERAGRYLVAVSGADARAFGPFQLSAEAVVRHDGLPLNAGKRITDWLVRPQQSYVLNVDEPGLYTISMDSDEFDAQLQLTGGGLQLEDDDGGGRTNARLSTPLQPGRYTLEASAFSNGNGVFDLGVERTALPEGVVMEDGTELPFEGMANGFTDRGNGQRSFVFNLPERRRIQLDASSRELDTLLVLEGQGIAISDDDSGGGNNSRISTTLDAGQYTVTVSNQNRHGGLFQLAASTMPPADGSSTRPALKIGREQSGRLHPGLRDLYTLEIPRAGRYLIGMSSRSGLDGMVTLLRDGEEIASQDDSDQGLDPALELQLAAGQYVLMAHSLDPSGSGSYQLLVKRK
ncbi:MAG: ABC transporter substrate-binding protein [Stenotrophomonas sp.]